MRAPNKITLRVFWLASWGYLYREDNPIYKDMKIFRNNHASAQAPGYSISIVMEPKHCIEGMGVSWRFYSAENGILVKTVSWAVNFKDDTQFFKKSERKPTLLHGWVRKALHYEKIKSLER